jgi:hypothetical protein
MGDLEWDGDGGQRRGKGAWGFFNFWKILSV